MKTAGYVRETAGTGTPSKQKEMIRTVYGTDIPVFYDGISTHEQRDLLCASLMEGDRLIMYSCGCLSDEPEKIFEIWKELYEKKVTVIFLKEGYLDTQMFTDLPAANGKERCLIETVVERQICKAARQREEAKEKNSLKTKEGMAKARKKGSVIGRPRGSRSQSEKEIRAKQVIRKQARQFGGSDTDAQLMALLNVSRRTYYKYKKEVSISKQLNSQNTE